MAKQDRIYVNKWIIGTATIEAGVSSTAGAAAPAVITVGVVCSAITVCTPLEARYDYEVPSDVVVNPIAKPIMLKNNIC